MEAKMCVIGAVHSALAANATAKSPVEQAKPVPTNTVQNGGPATPPLFDQLKSLLETLSKLVQQLGSSGVTQLPSKVTPAVFVNSNLAPEYVKAPGLGAVSKRAFALSTKVSAAVDVAGVAPELAQQLLVKHSDLSNRLDFLRTRVIPTIEDEFTKNGSVNLQAVVNADHDISALEGADASLRALAAKGAALTAADVAASFP